MTKINTLRRFVSALMHEDSEVTPVVIHSRALYTLAEKGRNEISALDLAEYLTRMLKTYCVAYAASAVGDVLNSDYVDEYIVFGPNVRESSLERVLSAMRDDPFSQFDGGDDLPEYIRDWWLSTHADLPAFMADDYKG